MSDAWVGAAFTALGAVIGALSSSITAIISGRRQMSAEMKKVAVQMALEDFRFRVQDTSGRVDTPPASALIFYYDRLIDLTVRHELNEATVQEVLRDQWNLQLAIQEEADRLRSGHTAKGRR